MTPKQQNQLWNSLPQAPGAHYSRGFTFHLIQINMTKEIPLLTCRYEETANEARLQIWGIDWVDADTSDDRVKTYKCPSELMPEWMHNIRSIAVVGGHMPANPNPPPSYILWFETALDHTLVRFVNELAALPT
jgi:hypothetical protein